MAVFFIESTGIQNGLATITGDLLAHLRASLRVTVGEHLWLGDERRHRYLTEVTEVTRQSLQARVLEELDQPRPGGPGLILAQALLKGDRMDWVIQKATELGVVALVPLLSARVIVRPRAGRLPAQMARWQRIALEAAQQSEQWAIPDVNFPQDFTAYTDSPPPDTLRLILTERSSGPSLSRIPLPQGGSSCVVLAVGPEGGWAKQELDQALAGEWIGVTLGPRILRAETAALAALSVLQSRLGELG